MGKTRAEVREQLTKVLRDLDRGLIAPKDKRRTVGDYLDQWLETKKPEIEYNYWKRCEFVVCHDLKPALGKVALTKPSGQQLRALYARKLEDALRLDLVGRNVADLVRPPKAPHLDMKVYTPDQANQLLEAAGGDRLEALYLLMLTSACRIGELLGLRWSALDLERGEMKIIPTLKREERERVLGRPKTPHSRRTIPLTSVAVASLGRHHARQAEEQRARGAGWNPDQLVFVTSNGTSYAYSNWRRQQYSPMIRKAGLFYIPPHNLRHTSATLLLLEGVQPIVVSEMLGHSSVGFMLSTYGHVLAEMRKPARDAMERLFGNAFGEMGAVGGNG
jgi:integrase